MYTIKIEEKIQFAYGFKVVKDYGTFDIPGHIVVKGHVYYYNPETQCYTTKDNSLSIDAKKYTLNLFKQSRYYKQRIEKQEELNF